MLSNMPGAEFPRSQVLELWRDESPLGLPVQFSGEAQLVALAALHGGGVEAQPVSFVLTDRPELIKPKPKLKPAEADAHSESDLELADIIPANVIIVDVARAIRDAQRTEGRIPKLNMVNRAAIMGYAKLLHAERPVDPKEKLSSLAQMVLMLCGAVRPLFSQHVIGTTPEAIGSLAGIAIGMGAAVRAWWRYGRELPDSAARSFASKHVERYPLFTNGV